MAQESCPTESLKGIICSEIMTLCIFSRRCLTARTVPGTEGGAHPWFRCSLQSDTTEEEGWAGKDVSLQALHLFIHFSELPWLLARLGYGEGGSCSYSHLL